MGRFRVRVTLLTSIAGIPLSIARPRYKSTWGPSWGNRVEVGPGNIVRPPPRADVQHSCL